MGIRGLTKLFTWVAFSLSVLAVLSCFFVNLIMYGMLCSIIGTILSVIVIFARTHYAVLTRWNHPSYLSLVFCSAPVIYVLVLINLHKA